MKSKILLCVLLLSIIFSAIAMTQERSAKSMVFKPSELVQKPKGFLNYLIDPSKFSMSHSYSISYYNIGKQGFSQGLYLNTMNYQLSNPLLMQVRIGYLHQPFGGLSRTNNVNGNLFIQRAMLQYKPSNNISFTIDYQVLPSPLLSPYYYGW